MPHSLVERELSDLVCVLTQTVPLLYSVRVFGSYESDRWNHEKSDVDVGVITRDETLSLSKDCSEFYDGFTEVSRESPQRAELRNRIKDQLNGTYKDRFSLALCSRRDVRELMFQGDGRGYIGLNILRGRRLYGPKNIFDYLTLAKKTVKESFDYDCQRI